MSDMNYSTGASAGHEVQRLAILGSLLLVPLVAAAAVPTQSYSHGDPTPEEQLMLEIINRARANPVAEAERFGIDLNEGIEAEPISPAPKQPLAFNGQLLQAARGHSQWMLDNDKFTHVQTGGIDPAARMQSAGYAFNGPYSYGENIVFRSPTGSPPPVGPTVALEHQDLFVDEGIEHRGHRVNLLTPSFREIGIGVGLGIYSSKGKDYHAVMVTQDFGSTGANPGPFLVGVAYRDVDGDGFYSPGEGLANLTITPSNGQYYALTSASGGYALPVTGLSGSIQVTFASAVQGALASKTVILTGENAKIDFEANRDSKVTFGFSGMRRSGNGTFEADLYGPANVQLSIEASEDLRQWSPLSVITLNGSTTPFSDTQTGAKTYRFYRAVKR